jgi:hypothetical protein
MVASQVGASPDSRFSHVTKDLALHEVSSYDQAPGPRIIHTTVPDSQVQGTKDVLATWIGVRYTTVMEGQHETGHARYHATMRVVKVILGLGPQDSRVEP